MSFEVSVKVALVGEVEFADKLLEILVGVHERNLQLDDCVVIYDFFSVLAARTLADGIQVTGRDVEVVGIVLHRTLFAEFLVQQCSEFVELFILAFAYVLLACGLVLLVYMLYV